MERCDVKALATSGSNPLSGEDDRTPAPNLEAAWGESVLDHASIQRSRTSPTGETGETVYRCQQAAGNLRIDTDR